MKSKRAFANAEGVSRKAPLHRTLRFPRRAHPGVGKDRHQKKKGESNSKKKKWTPYCYGRMTKAVRDFLPRGKPSVADNAQFWATKLYIMLKLRILVRNFFKSERDLPL